MDDSGAKDLDVRALQDEISSLPGVRAARVVSTPAGRIAEVHLVADGAKPAKQIVRDVQTLALAQFGTEVDYRVVSVVQFDEDLPRLAPVRRLKLRSTTWTTEPTHSLCRVTLSLGDDEATGEARGAGTSYSRCRLAAQAAVEAFILLSEERWPVDVADASVVEMSGRSIALVVLVGLRQWGEETLVGSALVRTDDTDASIRAVMDAFNRVLSDD